MTPKKHLSSIITLIFISTHWMKSFIAKMLLQGAVCDIYQNGLQKGVITYEFFTIYLLDSAYYKNTAPSAAKHQNLFICLRSCLLCFFSLTSSGADGLSAINQGPKKFTHSRCRARPGA